MGNPESTSILQDVPGVWSVKAAQAVQAGPAVQAQAYLSTFCGTPVISLG